MRLVSAAVSVLAATGANPGVTAATPVDRDTRRAGQSFPALHASRPGDKRRERKLAFRDHDSTRTEPHKFLLHVFLLPPDTTSGHPPATAAHIR
jgi:hypothetical protein